MTLDIAELAAVPTQVGGDPELLWRELRYVIDNAITNTPRSLQTRIGPSEVGHPCDRRLSYKLAGVPESNTMSSAWKATIGTAVHAWLEEHFYRANLALIAAGHGQRWIVEQRVPVGNLGDDVIDGSTDMVDVVTRTVIDWKVTTCNKIGDYKRKGPGAQYRTQAHLYGRGWATRGLPMAAVAIVFLPRDGELSQAHLWSEPYDERIAIDAMRRVNDINTAVRALGPMAHGAMRTADSYCRFCPWHRAASTDLTRTCPGHNPAQMGAHDNQLRGLISA